jgi:hypothetical protein
MSEWQHATPFRSHALVRAVIADARFAKLRAPAQAAILVAVIQHADHNGRWYVKAETLAKALGRSERRVRDAISECMDAGVLLGTRRRRPDGTLSVYDYELDDVIVRRADENVRLWTKSSGGRPGTSAGASADGTVRARTVLNGSMNGRAVGGAAAADDERFAFWLENIGIEYAHDPRAFAEEALRVLHVDAAAAEALRIELVAQRLHGGARR